MKWTITQDKMMSLALALFVAYAVMLLPVDALADTNGGDDTPIAAVLCRVVSWFHGGIGAGIATLAIIVVGIGALMGKVSWGMAMIVGLGVGIIFGADKIVEALGGSGTCVKVS